ncbi:hypothetical protein M0813_04959 [Anaeramoeba flamelloides]|uniref:Adenosine kinase n=1 Tax=Anaeramoeba flamelloides TaxID=1746091 RepID=A0ABQ8XIG0_9EUKA|nr:hypothetical protein M0813_04959 [Anaeramoeba flamelloides]
MIIHFSKVEKRSFLSVLIVSLFDLVGFGTPLVDIIVPVSHNFLRKNSIPEDENLLITEPLTRYLDALKVENVKFEYRAGGGTTNTLRICQWLLGGSGFVVDVGSIGKDANGELLLKELEKKGIVAQYSRVSDFQTGSCLVLVTGKTRTTIAHLGASQYCPEHFLQNEILKNSLSNAKIMYLSSYYVNTLKDKTSQLLNLVPKETTIALNLSASYLWQSSYSEILKTCLYNSDLIFGNVGEAKSVYSLLNKGTEFSDNQNKNDKSHSISEIKEISKNIFHKILNKTHFEKAKILTITDGVNPTIISSYSPGDGIKQEIFDVVPCKKEEFVDSNGAGDAFVAGFLSQLIKYKNENRNVNLNKCLKAGHWAAKYIVTQIGCNLIGDPKFVLS